MTRSELIQDVKDKLEEISTANGYSFDIGSYVYDWLASPLPVDVSTAIIIHDFSETVTGNNSTNHELKLQIVLVTRSSTDSMDDVRTKMQDVMNALAELRSQTLVWTYDGSEIEVEFVKHKIAFAYIDFTVEYVTDPWVI